MAKVGYVGNTPNQTSVIIARQIYNITSSVGVVTFNSTYQPGYVDVYLNGVRLVDVLDYSAATGRTINLSADALAGDVLEVVAYKAFDITKSPIGIQSEGNVVKLDSVNTLNFIGAGNTFAVNGTTVDVSIAGGLTTSDVSTSSLIVSGQSAITNVTASGFATATQFSGNITGVAATFSGNVTIGGVLTYEDVTNIDAIGIITARSGVSIADSIFHTGDSNTAIRFPAADTFTVETAGSEALRIDSSQRLLKGHTTSEGMLYTGGIQVQGTNSSTSAITIKTNQNDSGGPALVLGKSRGSLGGTTVVQSGDQLGSVYFNGADGTDTNTPAAEIRCSVDGTPGSNDMPGRIEFHTTADGAATPTERLRITSAGQVQATGPGSSGSVIRSKVTTNNGGYLAYEGIASNDATTFSVNHNGAITSADTVSDSKGDVRNIPQSSNSSARTLVATDGGKVVMTTSGGWVIPASVMSQGNTVTLLNGDGSAQTINATALNGFYNTADGANIKASTISLGGASMATIWFSSGTVAYISATNMTVS